jgi:hypothetical protein
MKANPFKIHEFILIQNFQLKGTVQRKLTWVKIGINQQLMTRHCSDGYFFLFKGPSLVKKPKRVFSVKRHFVVE